jgi:hypothetical protein
MKLSSTKRRRRRRRGIEGTDNTIHKLAFLIGGIQTSISFGTGLVFN